MENPWFNLPEHSPFIAKVDAPLFERYPRLRRELMLDFLPAPYAGTPRADVFVLLLNPGGRNDDSRYGPDFVEERRRALRFESEWSFWTLNPAYSYTEGYDYANQRLRTLIERVGRLRLAQRMMWVQYLGYQ